MPEILTIDTSVITHVAWKNMDLSEAESSDDDGAYLTPNKDIAAKSVSEKVSLGFSKCLHDFVSVMFF